MKKRFLLLFIMMCLLGGLGSSLMAQEVTIKIGNKSTTSNYFPARLRQAAVGDSYNYSSISQQIYTADEIKAAYGGSTPAGKISKIAFKSTKTNITTLDKTVKVYMRNVDIDVITAWDTSNELKNNKVYEGSVSIDANGYLVFNLSPAFNYVEGKNILICVDNNRGESGVTVADVPFEVMGLSAKQGAYTVSGTASTNYGFDGTWPTCSGRTQKNVIEITFSSGVAQAPTFTDIYAYPSNNATGIFNPYLKFYAENKTHYKVLLSTSEDFLTNVTYVAGSATEWVESPASVKEVSTANISGLTYNPATKYYWKVIASNGGGQSDPTAEKVYSFTTKEVTTNPGAVTNMLPEDGATGLLNPELTWTYGDNTVDYQVIVDDEVKVDWTNIGYDTTGSYQTSDLSSGEHTWRVNTRNNNETYTEGSLYTFTVASLPDNVTPVSPTDGATGVASNVVRFQFAPNTTEYRLLYDRGYGFEYVNDENWILTNNATTAEFEFPEFVIGKTYRWAVDVQNSIGKRTIHEGGEEVAIYSFTVASTLPVANVAPENGANNLDNPVLSWNFKGNATHYMVYLGTEENNLTAQTEWIARGGDSGSYQTADLTPATKYFWRVDVKEGETVLAGDVWSFITTLPTPEAQANPAQVVPSYGIVYGGTTINWGKIETAQGYNVYLDGVKLNDELIPTNTNYYAILDNSMKLQYNMTTGYTFNVEAVYEGLGSVMSENVIVKVTGTGYLSATIYKNDYYNRLEGATITLSCTKDEFGNKYEEGNGRQYEFTTDSNGQYLSSTEGNERIQNGTYNVAVTKDNYTSYEGELTFTNNETSGLSEILTSENVFDVYLTEVDFYSVKINLETNKYGLYHVYRKNGNSSQEYLGELEFLINPGNESVTYVYNDWANLGKGNYLFGVSKIKDEDINWTKQVEIRNYDVFDGSGDWNTPSCWRDKVLPSATADVYVLANATIAAEAEITTGTVNIQPGGRLTINGSLTANNVYNNTKAGLLCINDGGELRQNNSELYGKFVMNIVKPSEEDLENWGEEVIAKTGWQFISSPVANVDIDDFIPANSYQGDYDLYKYDGNGDYEDADGNPAQWINHKNHDDFDTEFVLGRAYLASYNLLDTATFSGTLNSAKTFARQYSFTEENENANRFKNFFLVGNPFTFDMDLKNMKWTNVVEGVAIVTSNGEYEYRTAGNNGIVPVGDGFFIKTTGAYPSISYAEGAKRSEKVESINVIASNKTGRDNVIINLAGSENEGFPKLQNFNDEVANIYVQNGVNRYGIYNCDRDVNEVELAFETPKMGSYSISLDINGEFESVVLFDRLTGVETNMLEEDEYSFIATSTDDKNRFVVRMVGGQSPEDDSNFVYQSGEELVIEAEGTIQIIDMMGRVVFSDDVESTNNRINVNNLNKSAYIVRSINTNGTRTQKIVIL